MLFSPERSPERSGLNRRAAAQQFMPRRLENPREAFALALVLAAGLARHPIEHVIEFGNETLQRRRVERGGLAFHLNVNGRRVGKHALVGGTVQYLMFTPAADREPTYRRDGQFGLQ